MLTNNDTKLINSLNKKKFRQKYNLFIAEGVKIIKEIIHSNITIKNLYTTDIFWEGNLSIPVTKITPQELKKISNLSTPNTALAICEIPNSNILSINNDGLFLILDDINDPGNLGTIIRLADWFGVNKVICSNNTVDLYNPKTVQATMASITRVPVIYTNLRDFLKQYKNPIYGTFMEGNNIYKSILPKNAAIIMGNEANGISLELEEFITHKITIPQFGKQQKTESLNVAMATGIVLSEFLRR